MENRPLSYSLILLILASLLTALPLPAFSQEASTKDSSSESVPKKTLGLPKRMDVNQLIGKISKFTSQNYSSKEEIKGFASLDLPTGLSKAEASRFLEAIMLLKGYRTDKSNKGRWKFVKTTDKASFNVSDVEVKIFDHKYRGKTAPGDEIVVSKLDLERALENMPRALSQARAVPFFRNGKSIGMRLFAIRRKGIHDKMGLKNGDIILAINGKTPSDPAESLKIYEALNAKGQASIVVERNGQKISYSCRVEK